MIKKIEKARLKDEKTYYFTMEIRLFGLKIYEYSFESQKIEYVNEYKQESKVGFK